MPSAQLCVPSRHGGLRGLLGVHPALAVPAAALALVPAYIAGGPVLAREHDHDGRAPEGIGIGAFDVASDLLRHRHALAGVAGALAGPVYFSPPGTLQYISFNSIFYLSVPVLAGFDSTAGTVVVAVTFTLVPQIVLSWELNVYLLGGTGMTLGVLLGPRALAGAVAARWGGRGT